MKTTEEKTVKDWLNTLKEPYKSKALNNLQKEVINVKVISISKALKQSFDWDNSQEGWEYWNDLASSLENIEK
jgi:hypothetical protein